MIRLHFDSQNKQRWLFSAQQLPSVRRGNLYASWEINPRAKAPAAILWFLSVYSYNWDQYVFFTPRFSLIRTMVELKYTWVWRLQDKPFRKICPLSLVIQANLLPPSRTTTNKQKHQYPHMLIVEWTPGCCTVLSFLPIDSQWVSGLPGGSIIQPSQNKDPAERKQQVCLPVCWLLVGMWTRERQRERERERERERGREQQIVWQTPGSQKHVIRCWH